MKKIIFILAVVFSSNLVIANDVKFEEVKKVVDSRKDICSITYTIRETSNGVTTVSKYTVTAETCEEVKASAIEAGIIKAKK